MNKTKRIALAIASMFVLLLSANATPVEKLVIKLKDNTKVTFVLADKPKMQLQGNKWVVADSKNNTKEIAMADMVSYSFATEDVSDGINITNGNKVKPMLCNGHAYFENLKPLTTIRIITLTGNMVAQYKADKAGYADVDLTILPAGIYLIQAGKTTIKIMNK